MLTINGAMKVEKLIRRKYLEVGLSVERGHYGLHAVLLDESRAVGIDPEHHLQTARRRVHVLVGLNKFNELKHLR